MKVSKRNKIILYIFVILMGLLFVGPILFTVFSSLKNNTEIFGAPFALPKVYRFSNYTQAWRDAKLGLYMRNSIILSISSVVLGLLINSMASYVLSRFNFKMNKYLSLFFLMGMMIPMHTILVPITYIIGAFGWKNNLIVLVTLYISFSIPFSTAVLTSFMKGITKSVEEAALIDGASFFQIFLRIILPMSGPAISTIAIMNFLGVWNDVLFPLLFLNDPSKKTLALGLLIFNGERGSEYGPMFAAIAISLFIPIVIYLFFQEKIEEGMASGVANK